MAVVMIFFPEKDSNIVLHLLRKMKKIICTLNSEDMISHCISHCMIYDKETLSKRKLGYEGEIIMATQGNGISWQFSYFFQGKDRFVILCLPGKHCSFSFFF